MQAGKTTLVRTTFEGSRYANLEDPEVRSWAQTDPRGFLQAHPSPAVFDEIQRVPELLSYLQVAVDQREGQGQYILTGSNQPLLGQAISQSLAGRTSLLTILPLSLAELESPFDRDLALVKGFLPRVHQDNQPWHQAYLDYVATYVERDLRMFINLKDLDHPGPLAQSARSLLCRLPPPPLFLEPGQATGQESQTVLLRTRSGGGPPPDRNASAGGPGPLNGPAPWSSAVTNLVRPATSRSFPSTSFRNGLPQNRRPMNASNLDGKSDTTSTALKSAKYSRHWTRR